MRGIIFDADIDKEPIEELMVKIDYLLNENPEEDIAIYFTSQGGYVHIAQSFIHYLNNNNTNVILIGMNQISSAAIDIFVGANVRKEIMAGTWGMLHLPFVNITTTNLKGYTSFDKFQKERSPKREELFLKEMRILGLKEEELKELKKGGEIYLETDRLVELIEKAP